MAVTVAALNQTVLDACDSVTDNNMDGVDTVDFKENSASVYATKRSSGNNDCIFTKATGVWDLSGTGVHVRFWLLCTSGALINLEASGGIQLGVSDGVNTGYWYISGRDTYPGGWYNFVVDVSAAVDAGTKPTDMSQITDVIVRINLTAIGKNVDNIWIDNLHVCDGLRAYGDDAGSPFDFEDIFAVDNTDNSATVGGWGIIKKFAGIYFVCGELEMGDSVSTNACDFQAQNQTVVFEDRLVNAALYNITVVDNGTGTTEFYLGSKSGTAGINGCTITVEDTAQAGVVDFIATDADITDFGLYGTTFFGLDDISLPATASTTEVLNCNFNQCGQVDPSTCTVTNCNFIATSSTTGAVLFDQATHSVTYCAFIANTYAIEVTFDGALGLNNCTFTNNTTDVNNNIAATNMDSYQPTEDGDVDVYSGSITRVAQQFTATVGDLSRAIWSIRKQGTPTGNVYAKLYANSGGAPTGTALATSNAVSIAGLTTSFADVDFEFEDEFTLSATDYHISIEFTGGDSSNRLEVEYLTAGAGGETCNTYVSSWGSQTYDCRFQVNRDGIVKINATDSNPSTAEETAATKGATIIVNTVTLKVTVKDEDRAAIQNAQTSIYLLDSPFTELMNEDTTALGVAEADYNYVGDVDVMVRVRKSETTDVPRYFAESSIQTIDSSGLTLTVTLEVNPYL
jgi:hypothetical protein